MARPVLRRLGACALGMIAAAGTAQAAPDDALLAQVRAARPAVIATLKDLVEIESGSRDLEGLAKLADLIQRRLEALGGKVEQLDHAERSVVLHDAPAKTGRTVVARFAGTGQRRLMLLAHMDTVYPRGTLAKLPFRVEGNLAYGPGIADDKSGIANILHALKLLADRGFRDYAQLTVVINADEEISTPGARAAIARLAGEHDAVLSCEPTSVRGDAIGLATSGIGAALLTVRGKSAHAGVAPELGRNALVELSHQITRSADLADPARGIKFSWTVSKAGTTRNVIPDEAFAAADVRVQKVADYDAIEKAYLARVSRPVIEGTRLEAVFERRRPPLEATPASRAIARLAQSVYAELGRTLVVDDEGRGGGTDAAFASSSGKPVVESFGYAGWNYHSNEAEYVDLESIEPRLYLLTRMVIELSRAMPAP
jgi:glutamate carboxypeptidase